MTPLERAEIEADELYGAGTAISLTTTAAGYRIEVWNARGALLWSLESPSKRRSDAVTALRRELAKRSCTGLNEQP